MAIIVMRENEDGTRDMMVAGTVTRDAKLEYTRNKNLPKVTFGLCYASKKFMNVLTLGDEAQTRIASCLEKGDGVLVVGVWSSRDYTTKDGEKKSWSELKAEVVIPQPDISASTAGEQEGDSDDDGDDEQGDYQPMV